MSPPFQESIQLYISILGASNGLASHVHFYTSYLVTLGRIGCAVGRSLFVVYSCLLKAGPVGAGASSPP